MGRGAVQAGDVNSIASRIPPGRVEDQGDMKDVIANRFSMCTLELNDVVLVFDVVVM